jgi:hypothetical protein
MPTLDLEIRHRDPVTVRGTLPWLVAHAGYVEIMQTGSYRFAYLHDKGGEVITRLACLRPSGEVVIPENDYPQAGRSVTDLVFTPDAWRLVEKLAKQAAQELRSSARECAPMNVGACAAAV